MGRQELYQAIGYSPDEEYIEYPKDVSGSKAQHLYTACDDTLF